MYMRNNKVSTCIILQTQCRKQSLSNTSSSNIFALPSLKKVEHCHLMHQDYCQKEIRRTFQGDQRNLNEKCNCAKERSKKDWQQAME